MILVNASDCSIQVADGYISSDNGPFHVTQDTRQITITNIQSHTVSTSGRHLVRALILLMVAALMIAFGDSLSATIGFGLLIVAYFSTASININFGRSPCMEKHSTDAGTNVHCIGDVTFSAIKMLGSGDVHLRYQKHIDPSLSLDVTGSGNICVSALSLRRMAASIRGSGDIKAVDVTVGAAVLRISGSGDIRGFHITDWADAKIRGSGSISCTTNRTNCETNYSVSGSGSVKFIEK